MEPGMIVAAVAAVAVLLIAVGIAGSRQEDPLKARLNQLGQMTAKDLQELELQQPFFDRTIKPLAARLSGTVGRITSSSFSERTEKRLAMAGNPGEMKVGDWLASRPSAPASASACCSLFSASWEARSSRACCSGSWAQASATSAPSSGSAGESALARRASSWGFLTLSTS